MEDRITVVFKHDMRTKTEYTDEVRFLKDGIEFWSPSSRKDWQKNIYMKIPYNKVVAVMVCTSEDETVTESSDSEMV